MKVLMTENNEEGFLALIGKNVEIQTGLFIYAGKLIGVNSTCVKLDNAHTVFDTGDFKNKKYSDAQARENPILYVQLAGVFAFNETSKI
jgi:hypothetical protein